jgi:isopenicillin N synthase-like dioxygenase
MHRKAVVNYSKSTNFLYLMLMEAILESLGLEETTESAERKSRSIEEFEDGSQLIVANCYPACPEPDLTLGMPPHSDYGLLTLLLQDEVEGLQIQHEGRWVTVEPLPNSFVVNVGDHLEVGNYQINHHILA